jgi:hypothetical protein
VRSPAPKANEFAGDSVGSPFPEIGTVRIRNKWSVGGGKLSMSKSGKFGTGKCDLDMGMVLFKGTVPWQTCDATNKVVRTPLSKNAATFHKKVLDDDDTGECEEVLICKLDKLPRAVTTAICFVCVSESPEMTFEDAKDMVVQIDNVSNISADYLRNSASASSGAGSDDEPAGPCQKYTVNMSAVMFATCICGHPKTAHDQAQGGTAHATPHGGLLKSKAKPKADAPVVAVKPYGDEEERLRLGISAGYLAETTAVGDAALARKQGLVLGAFNRLADGQWYFDASKKIVTGDCTDAKSAGFVAAFSKYLENVKVANKKEEVHRTHELKVIADVVENEAAGAKLLARLKIETKRVSEEKSTVDKRIATFQKTLHSGNKAIAAGIWKSFQTDLKREVTQLHSKIQTMDKLFIVAAREVHALQLGTLGNDEAISTFVEDFCHPDFIADEGVPDENADGGKYSVKQLLYLAISDNEEIAYVLASARAWLNTLETELKAWGNAPAAFPGVKVLHLMSHMELSDGHAVYKEWYAKWLEERPGKWKTTRNANQLQDEFDVDTYKDQKEHGFRLNDTAGSSDVVQVDPQRWLKKKSSLPQLETMNPILRDHAGYHGAQQEHKEFRSKIKSKQAEQRAEEEREDADRKARLVQAAKVKTEKAAEARRVEAANHPSIAVKAKKSALKKKVFGAGGLHSSEASTDNEHTALWGFDTPTERQSKAKTIKPAWMVERDAKRQAKTDAIAKQTQMEVEIMLPVGLSIGADESNPGGFKVTMVNPSGNAARMKAGIQMGMEILTVNGKKVNGLRKDQLLKKIQQSGGSCTFTFEKLKDKKKKAAKRVTQGPKGVALATNATKVHQGTILHADGSQTTTRVDGTTSLTPAPRRQIASPFFLSLMRASASAAAVAPPTKSFEDVVATNDYSAPGSRAAAVEELKVGQEDESEAEESGQESEYESGSSYETDSDDDTADAGDLKFLVSTLNANGPPAPPPPPAIHGWSPKPKSQPPPSPPVSEAEPVALKPFGAGAKLLKTVTRKTSGVFNTLRRKKMQSGEIDLESAKEELPEREASEEPAPSKSLGKKLSGFFNTLRRKKLQEGGANVEKRTILRTMEFDGGSEFESCTEGDEVTVVRALPDGTVVIKTEEGQQLLHPDAFIKPPADELGGVDLELFDDPNELHEC